MFLTIFRTNLDYLAQNIGIRLDIQKAHFYDLIDILFIVRHFDFQVVTCKSRHHSATHRTLEQHLHFSTQILLAKIVVATTAQLLQALGSRHRNLRRNLIRKVYCRGILSLRVGEDVEERRTYLRKEVVTLLKLLFALARETRNYIYSDEGVGHRFSHRIYALLELLDSVATTHQTEHLIRATLNRDMEVMLKFR